MTDLQIGSFLSEPTIRLTNTADAFSNVKTSTIYGDRMVYIQAVIVGENVTCMQRTEQPWLLTWMARH